MKEDLEKLIQLALSLGASEAHPLSSAEIIVEDHLALKCFEPKCENYGHSFSCPPYVEGPDAFRKLIKNHSQAIVIRLVIPSIMLLSWERLDVGRVLHELVASVESDAKKLGYSKSSGFAGGSCKELFCQDHLYCQRIERAACRHPELARPSLSGYGVDVFRLIESCGWDTNLNKGLDITAEDQLSWVAGLVMIG
jgi:predicted metal-binding protein